MTKKTENEKAIDDFVDVKKYFGITLLKNGGDYKMKYYFDELRGEEEDAM